ncbi:MAG: magnesium transporter [Planctomycetota bacterium]|nr:magnesium transporter [Planctomycetota bacterium]
MTEPRETRPWEELEEMAERGDARGLEACFRELSAVEAARAMSRLAPQIRGRVLATLAPPEAAELMEAIPDPQAADVLAELPAARAAAILHEMPGHEQADLISELGGEQAEEVLSAMDPAEAGEARRLAAFDSDVAGGLMITQYLAYRQSAPIEEVVGDLRRGVERYSDYDVQYVYVVSAAGALTGVLPLRDVLLARPGRSVAELMIPDPLAVDEQTSLDELGAFFDRHNFIGVPVTDAAGRLVGVVRRHDVNEARAGRAGSDYLKALGIVGGEELRSMPLLRRCRRRLSWLSINIVLNIIAASVIAAYQETLAAVIALAVFLPIISDMSGCSGNQAVAVSMRELTLGLIRPSEAVRTWLKEVTVGLINGLVLGLLLGLAAYAWRGNAWLGLVVGAAMALNTIVAVSIGGVVPLLLKRLRFDPALASGPILTTVTDMCGFFLVLSFATLMLSRLTG